jgi:hypothetical protein
MIDCMRTSGAKPIPSRPASYGSSLCLDVQQPTRLVQILHFAAMELTGAPGAGVVLSPVPGPFLAVDQHLQSHITKEQKTCFGQFA